VLAIVVGLLTFRPAIAAADTVWIGELGANPIKASNVKIQSVDAGKVTYTTESGASSTKSMDQLQLIGVDGETSFDSAEQAFVAKNWNDALTGYQSALQSSSKDWIKKRSAGRLSVAAKQLNRFDAEVAAYVALLQQDPAAADATKPAKPTENSANLDSAISIIGRALDNPQLNTSQKSALLGLQLDIYRAKKDSTNVNQTMQQLVALGGGAPSDAGRLKVDAANVAYDSKQYSQAISIIEQNKAIFTEPDQQVDALFVLAESKEALDGNKTDTDVLKDLALGYMRVVTFGDQLPDKPHVPESLFRAGQLEEKLKEPQSASSLYQQIIKNFPASSVAADARAAEAKVGK
jgi:tetratricopeptide (TPR) repeat protein